MARRRHVIPWRPARPVIDPQVASVMREEIPGMAQQAVRAIQHEVEEYADPFRGEMGRTIENAVALALGGFLELVSEDARSGSASYERVWEAAHALGRGEARGGRSMDALLRAYRVGARVSWRDMSAAGVRSGLDASTVAEFAELVFSYIDELSAASAAGHAEERATAGRVRQRLLERLAEALVVGDPTVAIEPLADRAGWPVPDTVSVVLVPEGRADQVRPGLPAGTLQAGRGPQHEAGLPPVDVLVVPGGPTVRPRLLRALRPDAVVGPTLAWQRAAVSTDRAVRVLRLRMEGRLPGSDSPWGVLDADEHLVALALSADEAVVADLRAQVLAPLDGLRPATADKLVETLRAWLLHQGRREDVAQALFVHPQTVRYRLGQLREAFGDQLQDPEWALRATLALGLGRPSPPDG